MGHYWAADTPVEIRRELALDWMDDLREFGPEIVSIACGEWRRQPGGRRPTPGDIRTICIREREERRPVHTMIGERGELRWESWLYDIWGPAATGMPARAKAAEAIALSLRKAEIWRESETGRAMAPSGFQSVAQALGVTAREFTVSPGRMAEDRRALGLEPQPPEETP